jgi:hypothetical protein
LSFAGASRAEGNSADAAPVAQAGNVRTIDLSEGEVFAVTLAAFSVFDRENVGRVRAGEREAYCRGCGTSCGYCRVAEVPGTQDMQQGLT